MKHKWLIAMMAMISFGLNGQEMPTIIPPSPEASTLTKYTEIPVSLNNGLANISIPIHTIDLKGISIPINLSYHTRGVKVDEIASRVGIGWTLNHGGMISRTTLGRPDDAGPWAYLNQNFGTDLSSNQQTQESVFNYYCASNGEYDLESDVFHLNAGAVSGKFFFEQSDKINPVLKEFDDIKVTARWEQGIIVGFIVKDKSGNTYYFGKSKNGARKYFSEKELDNTSVYRTTGGIEYGIGSAQIYKTYNAWHLVEIETPYNQKIEFFYDAETVSYVSKFSDSYTPQLPSSPDAWINGWRPVIESEKQCMFSLIREKQYQISEIRYGSKNSTSLKKVIFNKSTANRQDLTGSHALESIDIKDENDRLIKSFGLTYTYSHNTVNTGHLFALSQNDPASHYRLMLSSVQEKDTLNNTLPPFKFEYNSMTLPNRFSNSKDVWGYYNGQDNGYFLTLNPYNIYVQPNREIDTVKSEAGILKKVTYPTGGYSTFTYGHNKAIPSYNMNQFLTYDFNPTKNANAGLGHLDYSQYYNGNYYEKEFTVTNIIRDKAIVNVWFDDDTNCLENAWEYGCKFRVTVTKISGAGGLSTFELFKGNNKQIILTDGVYKLKVQPMDDNHTPTDFSALDGFGVSINWKESVVGDDIIYGPGKRIEKIEFFDSNGDFVSKKEYEYKKSDGTSSGMLIGLPDFYSVAALSQPNFQYHTGVMAGSNTNVYQPNGIAYGMVTEYLGEKGNNVGKTVYEFTTILDGGAFYTYPYFTPNDNEWLRGKSLSTKLYSFNQQTGLYTIKKEIINRYLYANTPDENVAVTGNFIAGNDVLNRTKGLKHFIKFVPRYTVSVFNNTVGGQNNDSGWHGVHVQICDFNNHLIYQRASGSQDLYSTVEKTYSDSGILETTKTYNYDYNKHYQVKGSTTRGSDNKEIETKFYYPTDGSLLSGFSSAVINSLLGQNRFEVLQTEVYKANALQSTQRTLYKDWGNGIVLPQLVQASKGSQALEDRIEFKSYDNKGNVIEVKKTGGTHVYYIWGYDQSLPIAKLENFTQSDANTISGLITTAQSTTDENALRLALDNIRNHSATSKAQVTTFTYDPLIGVTSITDVRGDTMYYVYDSFNRLKHVKDKDGNILKEHHYNYKNQ